MHFHRPRHPQRQPRSRSRSLRCPRRTGSERERVITTGLLRASASFSSVEPVHREGIPQRNRNLGSVLEIMQKLDVGSLRSFRVPAEGSPLFELPDATQGNLAQSFLRRQRNLRLPDVAYPGKSMSGPQGRTDVLLGERPGMRSTAS